MFAVFALSHSVLSVHRAYLHCFLSRQHLHLVFFGGTMGVVGQRATTDHFVFWTQHSLRVHQLFLCRFLFQIRIVGVTFLQQTHRTICHRRCPSLFFLACSQRFRLRRNCRSKIFFPQIKPPFFFTGHHTYPSTPRITAEAQQEQKQVSVITPNHPQPPPTTPTTPKPPTFFD